MIRLYFIVEGHTERNFVDDILAPYLKHDPCIYKAGLITTSRDKSRGRVFKGGLGNYEKVKNEIERWLKTNRGNDCRFTTMFDYYALPDDFPGFAESRKAVDPYEKVKILEDALAADIGDWRMIPYIQLHEFEAMIFVDPIKLNDEYPDSENAIRQLTNIADQNTNPELINDGNETAPSKRILHQIPEYDKTFAGVNTVDKIGIDAIRNKCPHFDEWLKKLKNLKNHE